MAEFAEVKESLTEKCTELLAELNGRQSKAAYKRARQLTKEIAVLGKEYRKLSTKE